MKLEFKIIKKADGAGYALNATKMGTVIVLDTVELCEKVSYIMEDVNNRAIDSFVRDVRGLGHKSKTSPETRVGLSSIPVFVDGKQAN